MINQQTSLRYYIRANQTCNFGHYDLSNKLSATIFLRAKQGFVPTHAVLTADALGTVSVWNATDTASAVQVIASLPAFSSRKLEDGDDVVCCSLSSLGVYTNIYKFVREQQVEALISHSHAAVDAITYPTTSLKTLTSVSIFYFYFIALPPMYLFFLLTLIVL
jgi:hypothetical protein